METLAKALKFGNCDNVFDLGVSEFAYFQLGLCLFCLNRASA